jgi:D-alanyl-D-alanine carboxypeptidase
MHRGNRFLVGVVLGGRSGGSRDAIMRSLLASNLEKAAATRTVAAITERNRSDSATDVADAERQQPNPPPTVEALTSPASDRWEPPAMRTPASKAVAALAEATAAMPAARSKVEPPPLSSGVIQTQPITVVPGSSEPMKPVRVKTVQVKAGAMKVASAGPSQPTPPVTASPQQAPPVPETSGAVVAKAAEMSTSPSITVERSRAETGRVDLPPQPPGHGTGNGLLGVLPASALTSGSALPAPQHPAAPAAPAAIAVAAVAPHDDPQPVDSQPQAQPSQQNSAKPVVRTGWIIQVGALQTEDEAQQRIAAAKDSAHGLLRKADAFTEPVIAKDNRKLFRARFAGLERDQAEAVCRTLRRSDISCIAVRN